MKKIVCLDMDGVLCDFELGIEMLPNDKKENYFGKYYLTPGLYDAAPPVKGAIEGVRMLLRKYDVFVLTNVSWDNCSWYKEKIAWIEKYFGEGKECVFYKKIIWSHRKDLLNGDYLVDDRIANGSDKFPGEFIHFGSNDFPDWPSVIEYLN